MALTVYLIAGEASGDALGAGLMRGLKAREPGVVFMGIGGEKMAAEGLKSIFPYHELSLMGFAEILPHLHKLLARIGQAVEDVQIRRPDVLVTIDSPGFNFRVVEKLRAIVPPGTMRYVHYVAPSVWAYKPERAVKCAKLFDRMLALLPFEPPYFEDSKLPATFVGHPAAYAPKGDGAAFRAKHNIKPEQPLITLMPGSRVNELKRHLKPFAESINRLGSVYKDIAMAVPLPERLLTQAALYFEGCPFRTVLLYEDAEKRDALAASTVALIKSGTSSLEVAAQGCPQVVAYKAHPLTAMIVRRLIRIPYASIINVMEAEEVIPEFIQERCHPDFLTSAVEAMLQDPARRAEQRERMLAVMQELKNPAGEPGALAAAAVLKELSS